MNRASRLIAVIALVLLVVPVTIAGSAGDASDSPRIQTASIANKFKKLRRQVKTLQAQVDELSRRPGEPGPAGPAGPPGPQGVEGAPGSIQGAAAGGDLTGTYPNPQIAPNAVGTNEIADNSVAGIDVDDATLFNDNSLTQTDLGVNSVDDSELAGSSVFASEVGDAIRNRAGSSVSIDGGVGQNGSYNTGSSTASCAANEEIITGYGSWDVEVADAELFIQEMLVDHGLETVSVAGGNDDGAGHDLTAIAVCLQVGP